MYKVEELIKAARKIFGLSPVLVGAALKSDGKSEYTLEEARKTVEEFAGGKV